MSKKLCLVTFLGILLISFPAFAADEVAINEGGYSIAEDIDVGAEATGCRVSLPASVAKGTAFTAWANPVGGNFVCPINKAKFRDEFSFFTLSETCLFSASRRSFK